MWVRCHKMLNPWKCMMLALLGTVWCFYISGSLNNLSTWTDYKRVLEKMVDKSEPRVTALPIDIKNLSDACPYATLYINDTAVPIFPFTDFVNLTGKNCFFNRTKPEFALVIPDQQYGDIIDFLSIDAIMTMVGLMAKFDWLEAIGGQALVLEEDRPACTMTKKQLTIELKESYSEFIDGSKSITIKQRSMIRDFLQMSACYPCDLLPDIFLIRMASVSIDQDDDQSIDESINLKSLSELRSSARIPLFIELIGKSAYCPNLKMTTQDLDKPANLTCNNLRMIWDGYFVLLPVITGIYRLIMHSTDGRSTEYWLGCTWASVVYEARSPVHCSNWVRQFLFDVVDILEHRMAMDYRLLFGSVLGGVRSGDVIPWSVDADIGIDVTWPHNFRYKKWPTLGKLSQWRYSHTTRRGNAWYWPNRVFPSCPVQLTSFPYPDLRDDSIRIREISRLLKASRKVKATFSYSSDWRATGYVDVYYTRMKELGGMCGCQHIRKGVYEKVKIAGREFKTFPNQTDQLECLYGRNSWNVTPWETAKGWTSFLN